MNSSTLDSSRDNVRRSVTAPTANATNTTVIVTHIANVSAHPTTRPHNNSHLPSPSSPRLTRCKRWSCPLQAVVVVDNYTKTNNQKQPTPTPTASTHSASTRVLCPHAIVLSRLKNALLRCPRAPPSPSKPSSSFSSIPRRTAPPSKKPGGHPRRSSIELRVLWSTFLLCPFAISLDSGPKRKAKTRTGTLRRKVC
jgi:hypothetical protein